MANVVVDDWRDTLPRGLDAPAVAGEALDQVDRLFELFGAGPFG